MALLCLAFLCCFSVVLTRASLPCVTPNGEEAECVGLRSCAVLKEVFDSEDDSLETFLDASACGTKRFMVCCGTFSNFTHTENTTEAVVVDEETQKQINRENTKKNLLVDTSRCGMQHSDDYVTKENETGVTVDHFPWVLNVYFFEEIYILTRVELCTGVLINSRYGLTHGDCGSDVETVYVTIGQHFEYMAKGSCTPTLYGDQCTEPVMDLPSVEQVYSADKKFLLLRFNMTVRFSTSVRPICLPFFETGRSKIGDTIITSGWDWDATSGKKRIQHKFESNQICATNDSASENVICGATLSNNTYSVISRDHGGPILHRHKVGRYLNWYIEGVLDAKNNEYNNTIKGERITPLVVNWILDNIKP